jgi:hypothetical protein
MERNLACASCKCYDHLTAFDSDSSQHITYRGDDQARRLYRRFTVSWPLTRKTNASLRNRTYTYWEAYTSVQLQVTECEDERSRETAASASVTIGDRKSQCFTSMPRRMDAVATVRMSGTKPAQMEATVASRSKCAAKSVGSR